MEQHGVQRVARILRPDQLRQRHRHALGRREAILAVEDHAVAAVEHQHGRARALIFALRDHQVFVVDVDAPRAPDGTAAFPRSRALTAFSIVAAGIEVQRVAELMRLRRAAGFDAGGQVARVVPAGAALAERAEQIAQRAVAEKIERLVGDLELDRRRLAVPAAALARRCALGSRSGGVVM